MFILGQAFLNKVAFNYFDIFVVVWLILGVFLGRKRGMSQEFLPTLQWILIMVAAGLFYSPVAQFLREYANLDMVLASVIGYVFIGLVVHFIFLWVKNAIGEKLVGSDMFGRGEFYLGMTAGGVRFACMVICLLAVMNVRIISEEEMARTEKIQQKNFEDIRFPTYGSIQQAVLIKSFSGHTIKNNLGHLLIATVYSSGPGPGGSKGPVETAAKKKEQELNDILGANKK